MCLLSLLNQKFNKKDGRTPYPMMSYPSFFMDQTTGITELIEHFLDGE